MISEFPNPARLPKPVKITEQVWPEGTVPVVSIHCLAYNHANYIRDAIEGFLMQETTFPVEILIHDDASTDGTAEIVRAYQQRHPRLFRTVFQVENQLSKGIEGKVRIRESIRGLVRGKFTAYCEGDDFWISPQKLEIQVASLQAHPEAYLSYGAHLVVDEQGREIHPLERRLPEPGLLPTGAYFHDLCGSWQMASLLVRRTLFRGWPAWVRTLPFLDQPLMAIASLRGPICCIPGVHSAYRIHPGGIHSSGAYSADWQVRIRHGIFWNEACLRMMRHLEAETEDPDLRFHCRRKAAARHEDLVWWSRLQGERGPMRRSLIEFLHFDRRAAIRSAIFWKTCLIAFCFLPDFRRSLHVGKERL